MSEQTLNPEQRQTLLDIARTSISHGLAHGRAYPVGVDGFNEPLTARRASFVTLKHHDQLRGCIGRLVADTPLVVSVSRNAYAAAFEDPRFDPVTELQSRELSIHISVLSRAEPMSFTSEADLLDQLRPGIDGLVLESGRCRGTFLPAVWQTLPEPERFLAQLKVKAGLPPDAWPSDVRVQRYTSESVESAEAQR